MMYFVRRFLVQQRGAVLIEFAMSLPLLLVLFLGAAEFTRYVVVQQKVERAAYTLASITGQYLPRDYPNGISATKLTNEVFPQLETVMEPYGIDSNDRVAIITSVYKTGGKIIIKWQKFGGGTLYTGDIVNNPVRSIVNDKQPHDISDSVNGTEANFSGNAALLTTLADMQEGENMLVTEAFFFYRPALSAALQSLNAPAPGQQLLISREYYRPRQGDLLAL